MSAIESALRASPLYRRLQEGDRQEIARISSLRQLREGQTLFEEGDESSAFFLIVAGRVKVSKSTATGKDLILEILGPGEPVGAVAAYDGRPFPATAQALEPTVCVVTRRAAMLGLLERYPLLVRGLLSGLTLRLMELTRRLAELTGGRLEPRFARVFLKMADEQGRKMPDGVLIPGRLSRQELADLCATTVESCIRIMSRWSKEGILRSGDEGFLLLDRPALERLAAE